MNRIFARFCVVFAVILVVTGALMGFAARKISKANASSLAYVNARLPPILSTWSTAELIRHAAPEVATPESERQLSAMFATLRGLGPLEAYEGATGSCRISPSAQAGRSITADYVARARFQQGEAEIKVSLILADGVWSITGFHVSSPFLLK